MADATLKRVPVGRRVESARRRATTTPGQLRVLSLVIAVVTVALAVTGVTALVVADLNVSAMQQRTVPAIVGMQRIHAWLSDADRSAANAYLAGGSEVTLSQQQYEADIAAASRELQKASEHNPGIGDTSQRLQAVAVAVDQYAALIQTASVDDRLKMPVGTVYLHSGSNLMHRPVDGILAQVDALRASYQAELDRGNLTLRLTAIAGLVYAIVLVGLLGVLVHTQRFLRVRFRRRRNNRLLAATLLVVIVAAGNGLGAVQAARSVRAAQDESYARLLNLWTIRALVYDANGNESLSLISHGNAGTFDQAFQEETKRLVDRPLNTLVVFQADRGDVGFNGLMADELRSAGSAAERSAAAKALHAYQRFLDTDSVVRSSANAGQLGAASTLALGTGSAQLVFAFNELDWDLGVAIKMLQDQFDSSMQAAQWYLVAMAGLDILVVAVAALGFWAVQPRIDEYTIGTRR